MPVNKLFSSLRVSASGLTANRHWMDAIAENLANAKTTRTDEGGPYRRKVVTFQEVQGRLEGFRSASESKMGIRTTQTGHLLPQNASAKAVESGSVSAQVNQDSSDFEYVYDPDHPDADSEGYVAYPNVEVVREMVDLITASRAYEANLTAMNAAKGMDKKALEM